MKTSRILACLSTLLLVGSVIIAVLGDRTSRPMAEFDKRRLRVLASGGQTDVLAEFRVVNRGTAVLKILDVSTSCGCSVGSVEPKSIDPGASGVITVKGHPPQAGEQAVKILVVTNADPPEVPLELVMVGSKLPPFVLGATAPLQMGFVRPGKEPELLRINTIEVAGRPAWLGRVGRAPANLVVEGGLISESIAGENVVSRN